MLSSILATADRSGVVEEYHDGAVAVISPDGSLIAHLGEIDRPFYIRSSAKPFQALASIEAGADLNAVQLALACASHSGDPVHVSVVESVLAAAGLSENDLGCPPARPFPAADRRLAGQGDTTARRIYHNCSGKHAAMLAACVAARWPIETYLDPDHPLQQRVEGVLSEVLGDEPGKPGVDGCGAPVWPVTTRRLALAYRRLAGDERFAAIRSTMARYPMLVAGEGRTDGLIGRWMGVAAKGGAAGCMGVAYAGHGVAAKAWSGSGTVAGVGVAAALAALGCLPHALRQALADVISPPVQGGGEVVGRFRFAQVLKKA